MAVVTWDLDMIGGEDLCSLLARPLFFLASVWPIVFHSRSRPDSWDSFDSWFIKADHEFHELHESDKLNEAHKSNGSDKSYELECWRAVVIEVRGGAYTRVQVER